MNKKLNILFIGAGEWGKDTGCKAVSTALGLTVAGSSYVSRELVHGRFKKLYAETGDEQYNYADAEECWNDRRNQRPLWRQFIKDYNTPDLASLTRLIYRGNDIYNGIRDIDEFEAAAEEGLWGLIILVDASKRITDNDPGELAIPPKYAHFVLDNNGTKEEVLERLPGLIGAVREVIELEDRSYEAIMEIAERYGLSNYFGDAETYY